jgi:hypothetical protein
VAAAAAAAPGGHVHGSVFGIVKQPYKTELVVRVSPLTVRAAFSNVWLWAALIADSGLAGEVRFGERGRLWVCVCSRRVEGICFCWLRL